MARLQTFPNPADKSREERERAEDEALASRLAHLPDEEMRSFEAEIEDGESS